MEIENGKFIDVAKIVKYHGKDVTLQLPHIPAVTGCDTRLI